MALFNETLLQDLNLGRSSELSGLSPAEGVVAFLLAAVMADDVISNEETELVGSAVKHMKLFQSYAADVVRRIFIKVGQDYDQYGFKSVIYAAKEAIPFELKETVFAISTDLVLADGILSEEEITILTMMHRVLEIPESTAQLIIKVMAIKNRG